MATKKRDEAEIEATERELPLLPPQTVIDEIKGRQKAAKLVYRAGYYREPITELKKKAALVTCTACGERYFLDYSNYAPACHCGYGGDSFGFIDPLDNEAKQSGSTCICPECGAQAEGLHIGRIRTGTYEIERTHFVTMHNVRGNLVALSWVLFKECDKEGKVYYSLRRYEGIAVIGGRTIRYTGYKNVMYYGVSWSPKWEKRAAWKDTCDEWDEDEIFFPEVINTTNADKSALDIFIKEEREHIRLTAYLNLWTRFPHVENLVRNSLTPFLHKVINKCTYNVGYYGTAKNFSISEVPKYMNPKAAKPTEITGLSKDDLQLANKLDLPLLDFYKKTLQNKKIKLTEAQLKAAERMGLQAFEDLVTEKQDRNFLPPLIRTLNYLTKQKKRADDEISAAYLRDYWQMIKKINNGIPQELRYPKDLKRAHDLAVIKQQEKVNKQINENIQAFCVTLGWLAYEDEETGLMIRPAQSQDELIKEGKLLSHCVATYAKAVSKRETSILFIRHIADPDMPFFTLEYKDGKVIQNRGKHNCARTQEVVAFEAKWLDYIKNYKESLNNGKRIRSQAR